MAVPFDVDREEVRGEPFLVIDGVRTGLYGAAQIAVSGQGRLIYASGSGAEEASFVWIDRNGERTPLPLPRDLYDSFALSRDGALLALERQGDRHDIWVYDLLTLNGARLTSEGNNGFPVWSSDGKWLVFTSDRSGAWNLYRQPVEKGAAERLTWSELRQIPYSLSPDGEWLGFTEYASESGGDIWLLPMKGGKPHLFLGTRWHESQLVFSPDGKTVAYVSDASGEYEVYVARFPRPAESRKVSASGGEEPIRTPGGKELAYREGSRWMLVGIETEPEIRMGRRSFLFEGQVHTPGRSYDFAPDGERLLGIEPEDASLAFELKVIDDFRKSLRGPSRP